MRAFITGATGFVGPHLAAWLRAQGDDVQGSSRDGSFDGVVPASAFGAMKLVAWDLDGGSLDALSAAISEFQPEVVYHLAALSVPKECGADEPTPRAWAVNVEATRKLVELLCECSWRPRLIFTSTSHVYGPQAGDEPRVRETQSLDPRTGYAKTKLAAEQVTLAAVRAGRLDAVVTRSFKHAGPGQSEQMMLPEWVSQFVRGASPVEVQCLNSHVDLADVRDVVRAYRLLAERGATGEAYNVGSGVETVTGELFFLLRSIADPQRPYVEKRPGLRREWIADVSKLQAATNWRPEISLEQTIRDTLDDYRHRRA